MHRWAISVSVALSVACDGRNVRLLADCSVAGRSICAGRVVHCTQARVGLAALRARERRRLCRTIA